MVARSLESLPTEKNEKKKKFASHRKKWKSLKRFVFDQGQKKFQAEISDFKNDPTRSTDIFRFDSYADSAGWELENEKGPKLKLEIPSWLVHSYM